MKEMTMPHTDASGTEPKVDSFLTFLEDDIARHPERLQAVDARLVASLRVLTEGMSLDLDAPLSPADE